MTKGVAAVVGAGAEEVYAVASHALLSGQAVELIESSPIKEVIVADTVLLPEEKRFKKLRVVSAAPLLARAIRRIHDGGEVSPLFNEAFMWAKK